MSAPNTPPAQPSPADNKRLPVSPPRSPILDNEQPEQAFEEDIPKDDKGGDKPVDPRRPDRSD